MSREGLLLGGFGLQFLGHHVGGFVVVLAHGGSCCPIVHQGQGSLRYSLVLQVWIKVEGD